uniref:Uncharacterized protein n=1 Tax=Tanacetum cinerariifolium TaxID=118510 RepID=A0A6L2NC56_TANCI|nr:hypothetical protein [Tanacetum cinerariifolium]
MSSSNHPTSDIEDAFSSNSPDYTSASPDYFPASSGNTSYGLVPRVSPTLSLFHDDPYMKVKDKQEKDKSDQNRTKTGSVVKPGEVKSSYSQESKKN